MFIIDAAATSRSDKIYNDIEAIINNMSISIDDNVIEYVICVNKNVVNGHIVRNDYKCVLDGAYSKKYSIDEYRHVCYNINNPTTQQIVINHTVSNALGKLLRNDNSGNTIAYLRVIKDINNASLYVYTCLSYDARLTLFEQYVIDSFKYTYMFCECVSSYEFNRCLPYLLCTATVNKALTEYSIKYNNLIYGIPNIIKYISDNFSIIPNVFYTFIMHCYITSRCNSPDMIVYVRM